MAATPDVGFFGKLPGRTDFVVRGLPELFLTPFGDWIERSLAAGRAALGAQWGDLYLTSPVWHFALSGGLAGRQAVIGVMVPSTDRSGREYPFLVAACAESASRPATLATAAAPWLDRAAELAVAAVTRAMEPAQVELQVRAAGLPWIETPTAPTPAGGQGVWRISGAGAGQLSIAMPRLFDHASLALGRPSLWWGEGSAQVEPTTFVCDGLPDPRRFAAMIDGR